jgi:purine-binding chemotaxis protein CheW
VGEVIGIRRLDIESLEQIPPLLRDTAPDLISAIALLDAELLLVLQAARLVPESLWSDIGTKVSAT